MRTFALRNFRSYELSSPGTFAPGNESSMELSLPISELGRLTVRYGSSATVATEQTDQLAVVRTWPQLGLDITSRAYMRRRSKPSAASSS